MKKVSVNPIIIVAILFFLLGSALGINGIVIPFLRNVFQLNSTTSYLVLTATFSSFILFGYPSGIIITKYGYKTSMIFSFILFSIGSILFIPSGQMQSFTLFLVASFVLGMGNTLLQAAVNPYITIIGPIESAAQRMCLMTICNRIGWAIAPLFLALFFDITNTNTQLDHLYLPFYIITSLFICIGLFIWFVDLPEIKAEGEDKTIIENNTSLNNTSTQTSILQFKHLLLGAIALFFYVGIDTLCLVSIVDFANSIGLDNPEKYTSYPVIGISIGCILGVILVPKYLSQLDGLRYGTIAALIISIIIPIVPASFAIYLLPCITFFTCLTWGAIWPLAIANLGPYTKKGSSILVCSIVGGAILPLIFGYISDQCGGIQNAYILFTPALLFILYYAFIGYCSDITLYHTSEQI